MRFITLFFAVILFSNSLFSQSKPSTENLMTVIMLIDDDIYRNANEIRSISSQLELSEKLFIYQEKEKSTTAPFLLNFLVGFGIGSWVQGDEVGGIVGTVGGIGGYALMVSSDNPEVGAGIFLGTYLINLFKPFTYARSFNKKLKSVVGLTDRASLQIYPNIDVTQNGKAVPGISLSVGF